MFNYVCKKQEDGSYKVMYKSEQAVLPRGEYMLVRALSDFEYAKVELVNNQYEVVEDTEKKEEEDNKKLGKMLAKARLKDKIKTIDSDISGASTLAQLKLVLKDFLKDVGQILNE